MDSIMEPLLCCDPPYPGTGHRYDGTTTFHFDTFAETIVDVAPSLENLISTSELSDE